MKEKTRKWLLYYPNNDLCQSRKVCVFQKVLLKSNDVNSPLPHSSLQQSRRRRKSHLATAVIGGRPAPIRKKVCDWLGKQYGL